MTNSSMKMKEKNKSNFLLNFSFLREEEPEIFQTCDYLFNKRYFKELFSILKTLHKEQLQLGLRVLRKDEKN